MRGSHWLWRIGVVMTVLYPGFDEEFFPSVALLASRPILTTPRRASPRLLIGRSAAVVVVDAHRGLQYGSRDDSDDSGRRDRGARRERASAVGG